MQIPAAKLARPKMGAILRRTTRRACGYSMGRVRNMENREETGMAGGYLWSPTALRAE